jgi:hypothetical protein
MLDPALVYVEGRGVMDATTAALDKQVKEYDERLSFGQHPETKEWVVTQDIPHMSAFGRIGAKAVVVFGFQHRIPSRDEMNKMLVTTDMRRNDILGDIEAYNKGLKEARIKEVRESQRDAAEKIEFIARKSGESDHAHVSTRNDGKRRRLF